MPIIGNNIGNILHGMIAQFEIHWVNSLIHLGVFYEKPYEPQDYLITAQ
jgi:hypothetical protein